MSQDEQEPFRLPLAPPPPLSVAVRDDADDRREEYESTPDRGYDERDDADREPDAIDAAVASDFDLAHDFDLDFDLDGALRRLVDMGGSDLHLGVGNPPRVRTDQDLVIVPGYRPLNEAEIDGALRQLLGDAGLGAQDQRVVSYELSGLARFRVTVFRRGGSVGIVARAVELRPRSIEELMLPSILGDVAELENGLVLIVGLAGSGRSTTLAAIVDRANSSRHAHIVAIEDPIESVHESGTCIVSQRQVGDDTASMPEAVRQAMREDADVIVVGDLVDREGTRAVLSAVEAGHLVIATLHAATAAATIDRLVDFFDSDERERTRARLAQSLQAIVCQALCRSAEGRGRIAATEILVATPDVRHLLREDALPMLAAAMQSGSRYGMHTLNQDLADLVQTRRITPETARQHSSDIVELDRMLAAIREQDG